MINSRTLCRLTLFAAIFSAAVLMMPGRANAQVQLSDKTIPLDLAIEAAREAVRRCEASGYLVSASVVDVAGVDRAFLRGDHSTVHTRGTAFKTVLLARACGGAMASELLKACRD